MNPYEQTMTEQTTETMTDQQTHETTETTETMNYQTGRRYEISKGFRLAEGCAKDPGRYVFGCVRIGQDERGACGVASDGRILARVPIEMGEGERCEPVFLHWRDYKEGSKRKNPAEIQVDVAPDGGSAEIHNGQEVRRASTPDAEYPLHQRILNPIRERSTKGEPGKDYVRLALNPELLARLAAALGADADPSGWPCIVLEIPVGGKTGGSACVDEGVYAYTHAGGEGVLMPITTDLDTTRKRLGLAQEEEGVTA